MIALSVIDAPIAQVLLLLLAIALFDLPINLHFDIVDELGGVHPPPIAVVLWLDDVGLDPSLNTIDGGHPCCLRLSKRLDARSDLLECIFACPLLVIAGRCTRLVCDLWTRMQLKVEFL